MKGTPKNLRRIWWFDWKNEAEEREGKTKRETWQSSLYI
jgi:hypothetical protein